MAILPYLAPPQAGETLYSVLTRTASLMRGEGTCKITEAFFGRRLEGIGLSFPIYLDDLVQRLPRTTPLTADDLIRHHSLFPLYAPFREPSERDRIVRLMRESAGACITTGIARFGYDPLPRYCPECAREDMAARRPQIWRSAHQIPFVRACHRHGVLLHTVVRGGGKRLKPFYFPDESIDLQAESSKAPLIEAQLAAGLNQLLESNPVLPGRARVARAYRHLMRERGYGRTNLRMNVPTLARDIFAQHDPAFMSFLRCDGARRKYFWLKAIVYDYKRFPAPAHHWLLTSFFGVTFEQLFDLAMRLEDDVIPPHRRRVRPETIEKGKRSILAYLRDHPNAYFEELRENCISMEAVLCGDRAWYLENRPPDRRKLPKFWPADYWLRMDGILSERIRVAREEIDVVEQTAMPRLISKSRLLGAGRFKIQYGTRLGRLPRTSQLLSAMVETQADFARRRARWVTPRLLNSRRRQPVSFATFLRRTYISARCLSFPEAMAAVRGEWETYVAAKTAKSRSQTRPLAS